MSVNLADQTCVPCKGGVPPLTPDAVAPLLAQLDEGWQAPEDRRLTRAYRFKNFAEALVFANAVGAIAEAQGHHPDLLVRWGSVRVDIWTHKIDGLTESDFYFAAKCDRAYAEDRAHATTAS